MSNGMMFEAPSLDLNGPLKAEDTLQTEGTGLTDNSVASYTKTRHVDVVVFNGVDVALEEGRVEISDLAHTGSHSHLLSESLHSHSEVSALAPDATRTLRFSQTELGFNDKASVAWRLHEPYFQSSVIWTHCTHDASGRKERDYSISLVVDLEGHRLLATSESAGDSDNIGWVGGLEYKSDETDALATVTVRLYLVKIGKREKQRRQDELARNCVFDVCTMDMMFDHEEDTTVQPMMVGAAPGKSYDVKTYGPHDFPELHPDMGLIDRTTNSAMCFSGGGSRALSCAWGAMRALHDLGAMKRIRYQSCVSGGNWACGAYAFHDRTKVSDEEFLGGDVLYTPANDAGAKHSLSMAKLKKLSSKTMGSAASKAGFKDAEFAVGGMSQLMEEMVKNIFVKELKENFWNEAVADRFLRPFGINPDAVMTWNEETKACVLKRHPDAVLAVQNSDTPFLVSNSTLMAPSAFVPVPSADLLTYAVFESTPLTVGVPTPQTDVTYAKDSRTAIFWSHLTEKEFPVAGGAVEPIGHNTKFLDRDTVAVGLPYTLQKTVGNSSAAFAGQSSLSKTFSWMVARASYQCYEEKDGNTHPMLEDNPGSPQNGTWAFGDGGQFDNFGLTSMLRRKVENIVVCMNTPTNMSCTRRSTPPVDITQERVAPAKAQKVKDLKDGEKATGVSDKDGDMLDTTFAAFFGFESSSSAGAVYAGIQCFKEEDLWTVVKQLQDAAEAHEPVIAQMDDMQVLANPHTGVEAYTANITWCYNSKGHVPGRSVAGMSADEKQQAWDEIRDKGFNQYMDDDTFGRYFNNNITTFNNFPCYETAGQNRVKVMGFEVPISFVGYTNSEVNLVAEYHCWQLYKFLTTNEKGKVVLTRLRGDNQTFSAPVVSFTATAKKSGTKAKRTSTKKKVKTGEKSSKTKVTKKKKPAKDEKSGLGKSTRSTASRASLNMSQSLSASVKKDGKAKKKSGTK